MDRYAVLQRLTDAQNALLGVAAGAIAKKVLKQIAGTEILAYVSQVKDVVAEGVDHATVTMDDVRGETEPADASRRAWAQRHAELSEDDVELPWRNAWSSRAYTSALSFFEPFSSAEVSCARSGEPYCAAMG